MKTKILFFISFIFTLNLSSQETIYLETFTGQLNKGAVGSIPTVNLSGVTWDIDISDATFSSAYMFRVRRQLGVEFFQARNVGTSTWLSPVITITGYADVAFSLDVTQRDPGTMEVSDTVTTEYRINGGTWTTAATNGSLTGNNTVGVSQTSLLGDSLEIRVTIVNNDDNERHRFDNIEVTGFPAPVSYVFNGTWSPESPIGIAGPLDDITIVSGTVDFDSDTDCNNLTVNPSGNVTVAGGVTLTIANDMILESSSTQYSSLISDGTITGNVLYERHVNGSTGSGSTVSNDLVSAPLTGQTFESFRDANINLTSGDIGGTLTYLFGTFDPSANAYVLYTDADIALTLDRGVGYRAASSDNSALTFDGTVETGNVPATITSGGTSNWNLIGNPYPSYLKVQDFLSNISTSGLIDENAVGMYGYDGDISDGWVIYNLATTTATTVIAPGQGFFVNAEATGDVQFTPGMRTTGIDDDFITGRSANNLVYLKLNMSNATDNSSTDFYFNPNASLTLDPGYDATVWNNTPNDFSIYSHLVENNEGKAFALQALHSDDLLNVTVPLGVQSTTSEEIVFSISESTISETVNVYLEDTVNNTSTLLSDDDYILTPNSVINGTGRFFLRFVDSQLSVNERELETLNIFANSTEKSIVIEGLLQQQTSLKIYDIQGRIVANSDLELNTSKQSIDVSQLTSGIYVIQTLSNSGNKTKKVILR